MSKTHNVKQGEDLLTIAKKYGRSVQSLLEANKNIDNALCLMPGTTVTIPLKEAFIANCSTNKKHEFTVEQTPAYFTLQLLDSQRHPIGRNELLAMEKYTLKLQDERGKPVKDKTGKEIVIEKACADGLISTKIPYKADRGELTLHLKINGEPCDIKIETLIGHKDPVTTTSGKQWRLGALQLHSGKKDNVYGEFTKDALSKFKTGELLEASDEGEVGKKLEDLHSPNGQKGKTNIKKGGLVYNGPT